MALSIFAAIYPILSIFSMKHKWFTLIEILVTIMILSIALVAIIGLMRASVGYVERTRQETIAINLAREGMEAVYTLRDTNRLRRWGSKDTNRLCKDPWLDRPTTDTDCGAWMQSGQSYILLWWTTSSGEAYPYLSTVTGKLDLSDGQSDDSFSMQYGTGNNGLANNRYQSSWTTDEWYMYREIRGYGLYQKDSPMTGWWSIDCPSGTDTYTADTSFSGTSTRDCGDATPKEFRFCSRVEYTWSPRGKVELCGMVTNYRE